MNLYYQKILVLKKENETTELRTFTFCDSGKSYRVDNRCKLELSYFGAPAQRQFPNIKQTNEKDKKNSKLELIDPIMEILSHVKERQKVGHVCKEMME